jgi:hypothetical protein
LGLFCSTKPAKKYEKKMRKKGKMSEKKGRKGKEKGEGEDKLEVKR